MGNFSLDGLQAAKRLIQMEANGEMDRVAKNLKKNGKIQYSQDGDVIVEQSDKSLSSPDLSALPMKNSIKSKLPKEIVNSFKKQPSFSSDGMTLMEGSSILDTMNSMSNGKLFEEVSHDNVSEQQTSPNLPQVIQSSTVDYNAIQTIVESTIKRYMSSLKKSLLTESKTNDNTLQALKIGNTFSFIDRNGNLYEAKLKFIKNINSK